MVRTAHWCRLKLAVKLNIDWKRHLVAKMNNERQGGKLFSILYTKSVRQDDSTCHKNPFTVSVCPFTWDPRDSLSCFLDLWMQKHCSSLFERSSMFLLLTWVTQLNSTLFTEHFKNNHSWNKVLYINNQKNIKQIIKNNETIKTIKTTKKQRQSLMLGRKPRNKNGF